MNTRRKQLEPTATRRSSEHWLSLLALACAGFGCAAPDDGLEPFDVAGASGSSTAADAESGDFPPTDEPDATQGSSAVQELDAGSTVVRAGLVGSHEMTQVTGDFNGDGLVDVVIGLPRNPNRGTPQDFPTNNQVLVLHGQLDNNADEDPLALVPFFDVLGSSLTRRDASFGSAADPVNNPGNLVLSQSELFPGSMDGEALGAALAVGDFDGNGYDDLAIGAPLSNRPGSALAASGAIAVVYFQQGGFYTIQNLDQNSAAVGGVAESGDSFGETLAAGDFNCDGYDDLAVGVPQENSGAGIVHVFTGSLFQQLSGSRETYYHQGGLPTDGVASPGDNFGGALAAGQLSATKAPNMLGCESLAVGSPGENGSRGAVDVFYGSPTGDGISYDSVNRWTQASPTVFGAPEPGDEFGAMLGTTVAATGSLTSHDLWVVSGGERWSGCELDDVIDPDRGDPTRSPQRFVTVLSRFTGPPESVSSEVSGLRGEVSHYCGLFTPDAVEIAQKYPAIIPTRLGPVVMYLPRAPEDTDELLMTIHGSLRSSTASGLGSAYYYQTAFHDYVAADRGSAIVSPGMGLGAFRMYRRMFGNVLRADHFMNAIVDDLAKLGLETADGRFDLWGHSAGGQAVARYMYLNPDRVDRAVSSAPGTLLWNCGGGGCTPNSPAQCFDWPHGLGDYNKEHDEKAWSTDVYYDPSTLGYAGQDWVENVTLDPTAESSWSDFQATNYNLIIGDDDIGGVDDVCTSFPSDRIQYLHEWVDHYNEGNLSPASLCVLESDLGTPITHFMADKSALAAQMFFYDEFTAADLLGDSLQLRCN